MPTLFSNLRSAGTDELTGETLPSSASPVEGSVNMGGQEIEFSDTHMTFDTAAETALLEDIGYEAQPSDRLDIGRESQRAHELAESGQPDPRRYAVGDVVRTTEGMVNAQVASELDPTQVEANKTLRTHISYYGSGTMENRARATHPEEATDTAAVNAPRPSGTQADYATTT
jgi:hypothetical protein